MRNKLLIPAVLTSLLLAVSAVSPAAEKSAAPKKKMTLKDLLKSSGGTSRRATSVAGVRGLDEVGDVDTKARDFDAIDRLEKVQISDEELKTFLFEGLLK